MAQRYERSVQYTPPGADFSAVQTYQTEGRLAGTLAQFAGQRYAAARAEEGKQAGAQSTGTPKLKSNFTVFGRAYNNSALRNYAIEQYTEIEKELGRLENETAGDPDQFQARAEGLRRGMVKNALPQARGDITNLFNRRLAEGIVRLDGERIKQQKALDRGMLEQGLEVIADGISRKHAAGSPTLTLEAEEDETAYNLMIDGAAVEGTISPVEATAMKRDGAKRIMSQVLTGQFEREIQGGDPIGFLERLMDAPAEDLSDDEKQTLIGNLFTRLNRRNALIRESEQLELDTIKQRYAAGEKHATLQLLSGQLSTERIEKLVADDYLDPGIARTLQNELESGGAKQNDDRERFHVETNLLENTEEDIASNPRLTWETRRLLIAKRRDLETGWRSTQQAREGAERIDRALGIIPGMNANLLSEEDRRARDQALNEWYDQTDALAPEERQAKSIELSETVIAKVVRGNASRELRELEARLRAYTADKDPATLKGAVLKEYQETVARKQQQIEAARRRAAP